MKQLHEYKCQIENYLGHGMLSYSIRDAVIIAESKTAACKMASEAVNFYKCCKIKSTSDAAPDAERGIKWL